MSEPSWLLGSEHAHLLRAMHQMAWADGRLRPVERDSIVRLATSLGVGARRSELIDWLLAKPQGSADVAGELDPFDRRFLLSQAIRLASADGHYDEDERSQIVQWAGAFGFSRAELEALEAEVEREAEGGSDPFR